jgi:hydroxymethylpyrimidine/phosphomethylpyrimidine kinase
VPASVVTAQLENLFDDVRIDTVKIGMLGSAAVVRAVAAVLGRHRPQFVVLDPVMVATSGDRLLPADAVAALRDELVPLVDLITPNLAEAADLLRESEAQSDAELLGQLGRLRVFGAGVLITGGHAFDPGTDCTDLLNIDGRVTRFVAPRVPTRNTHGTGCTLAAAIAVLRPLRPDWSGAIAEAKCYLTGALQAADQLEVGSGHGPVHHFHAVWAREQSHPFAEV